MYGITPMTEAFARDISAWRYGGEYAVYDFEESAETLAELTGGDYVACVDADGRLIGYFCFGASARIPTAERNVYAEACVDIGLGLRPALCGAGRGRDFLRCGMAYAARTHPGARLRLTVARFNRRARTLYERSGFAARETVTHRATGAAFDVMTRP